MFTLQTGHFVILSFFMAANTYSNMVRYGD
jgi:hypothetical protein